MEKNKHIIKNDKGESIEARVLFTVEDAKTSKNYIVYTNDEKDSKGNIKTYASLYEQGDDNDEFNLSPIKSDEEYDFINKILSSLSEKENEKEENND